MAQPLGWPRLTDAVSPISEGSCATPAGEQREGGGRGAADREHIFLRSLTSQLSAPHHSGTTGESSANTPRCSCKAHGHVLHKTTCSHRRVEFA